MTPFPLRTICAGLPGLPCGKVLKWGVPSWLGGKTSHGACRLHELETLALGDLLTALEWGELQEIRARPQSHSPAAALTLLEWLVVSVFAVMVFLYLLYFAATEPLR